jgi:hypothetical protein
LVTVSGYGRPGEPLNVTVGRDVGEKYDEQ